MESTLLQDSSKWSTSESRISRWESPEESTSITPKNGLILLGVFSLREIPMFQRSTSMRPRRKSDDLTDIHNIKDQQSKFVSVFLNLSSFLWNIIDPTLLLKVVEHVVFRKLFIFNLFWVSLTDYLNLNFFIMSSRIIS